MKICPIHEDIANTNLEYKVCNECREESFEIARKDYPVEYARWMRDHAT